MSPSTTDQPDTSAVRRHPLTPAEKQAAELAHLMKNPEKPAPVPAPKSDIPTLRPPKDIIKNVSGSSAGAGSGDFHVYKHARRREYERLKIMEMADSKTKEQIAFEAEQAARQATMDDKTNKNKAKRDRRKAAQQRAKAAKAAGGGTPASDVKLRAISTDEEPASKKRKTVAPDTDAVVFVPRDSDE